MFSFSSAGYQEVLPAQDALTSWLETFQTPCVARIQVVNANKGWVLVINFQGAFIFLPLYSVPKFN